MKKKELKPVDHSKISYISLRKNLYIIPKALAVASEEKVRSVHAFISWNTGPTVVVVFSRMVRGRGEGYSCFTCLGC